MDRLGGLDTVGFMDEAWLAALMEVYAAAKELLGPDPHCGCKLCQALAACKQLEEK